MFRFFILLFLLSSILFSQQNSSTMLAVSDLIGQGVNQSEANVVTEQLRAELHKTGHFRIIERSQMQEILKEQGFQQTGCTSDACAVQVGQLLGVKEIIVGTIGIAGSYTVLTVRILDVQTSEVIVDETVRTTGGIDKMIEGSINEVAGKLTQSFSNTMNNALIEAAKSGNLVEIERLLKRGANINTKDSTGRTPLHAASYNDHINIVNFLISNGADVNAKSNVDATPLHMASYSGHADIVNFLVSKGANVNAKDNGGRTPLHAASYNGHADIVSFLIGKGADINAKAINDYGVTPLHVASFKGHVDIVEILISKGADVNVKDNNGKTPLNLAADKGNADVIEILKKHGAK